MLSQPGKATKIEHQIHHRDLESGSGQPDGSYLLAPHRFVLSEDMFDRGPNLRALAVRLTRTSTQRPMPVASLDGGPLAAADAEAGFDACLLPALALGAGGARFLEAWRTGRPVGRGGFLAAPGAEALRGPAFPLAAEPRAAPYCRAVSGSRRGLSAARSRASRARDARLLFSAQSAQALRSGRAELPRIGDTGPA